MLSPWSLPLICFRSLRAERHCRASEFLLPRSSSASLCTSCSILVGSCLSYANPCPITPNFYSYPFLIYGIPLGLTSHGTLVRFFFFPPIALLVCCFLTGSFLLSKILFWLQPQLPGSDLCSSAVLWFSKATDFSLVFCLSSSRCHSGKQPDRHGFFTATT